MSKASPIIYAHQRDAYSAVLATARLFFAGSWRTLRVKPRFSRFLSGPTGIGKTHLVRCLAGELGVPLLQLSILTWVPLGCTQRGARPTWIDVYDFARSNERGIIFLDETDKLRSNTPWQDYLRVEAFLLLDRTLPQTLRPDGDDYDDFCTGKEMSLVQERLRHSVFLVGAGAFQSVWRRKQTVQIGFNPSTEEPASGIDQSAMGKVVPPELANRFAGPILCLPPLGRAEYIALAEAVLPDLPPRLRTKFTLMARSKVDEAVASGLGCRWVEELLLHAMIACNGSDLSLDDPAPC